MRLPAAACLMTLCTAIPCQAGPVVLHVQEDARGGNGLSWESAFGFLQDALAVAESLEPPIEIHIAQGVYVSDQSAGNPLGTGDRFLSFVLTNGISLQGGYQGLTGDAGDSPDARDPDAFKTILSADLAQNDEPGFINYEENAYHVVIANGTDGTARLDGVTLLGGHADGIFPHNSGGGVLCQSGTPIVENCIFKLNRALHSGGGMFNGDGSASLIFDCVFVHNEARFGGGLRNTNSSPAILNCSFLANHCVGSSNGGGGVRNWGDATAVIVNCEFIGNSAGQGGGLYNFDSLSQIINCTFLENSATTGGAVYSMGADVASIDNSIIWASGPSPFGGSSTPIATYSNIEGGFAGVGNINAQPAFASDPSAGDDGQWGTSDDDFGLLQIVVGSPGIDAGSNIVVPLDIDTDMASQPRFRDDLTTPDTGLGRAPIVDMGAYEFQPGISADLDGDGIVGPGDLAIILGNWGLCPANKPCPADLSLDGQVGPGDLAIVLGVWGTSGLIRS